MHYSSHTEWGLVLALIRSTAKQPGAARQSFELITSLISDEEQWVITMDNFTDFVELLNAYATSAGQAVETGGQHDKRRAADSPL